MSDTMIENEVPQWRETGRSPEWNELFAALAKAQGEIGGAKKDSTNPHFRSSYADLASVREVTREPLSKNGLAVVQWPRTANGGVEIETILGHSSGQYMTCVLWMPVAKMDAHGVGSAITYGRRYALMAVTGVAPVDDDGNGASDRSGVPGSAGGGTDFRPERRSYSGHSSANGRRMAADEPHLVDNDREKGTLPPKAANTPAQMTKRMEWVKAAIEGFKAAQTKDELVQWWKAEAERLAVIEDALPAEFERLLAAYDAAIERTAVRIA
jgi:ERF superfamily